MVEGTKKLKKRFCFLHPDMCIGGAEQFVLNLARASLNVGGGNSTNNAVDIYTAHCDLNCCFQDLKPPDGIFCNRVHVYGGWIPKKFGGFTALCTHLRLIYLSIIVLFFLPSIDDDEEIIYVVDVVPSPFLLLTNALLLYLSCLFSKNKNKSNKSTTIYVCNFPDKLLTQDTINGQTQLTNKKSIWKRLYRTLIDLLEESSMPYADLISISSKFTMGQVKQTFPFLDSSKLHVIYPPIRNHNDETEEKVILPTTTTKPIVSLNRFERKKNVSVLLKAYAKLIQNHQNKDTNDNSVFPPLVIAGGYDIHNMENVEHHQELVSLANDLNIPSSQIKFCKNISDHERKDMLQNALCVCYTPKWEHFGIVPLEAMYAGTPVIAWNCGGPKETVVHKQTGYLVDLSSSKDNSDEEEAQSWTTALQYMMNNSNDTQWKQRTKQHVQKHFAWDTFVLTWEEHISKAQSNSMKRHEMARKRLKMIIPMLVGILLLFIVVMVVIMHSIFLSHSETTEFQEL